MDLVGIEPWGADDLFLLQLALGDPEMTRYLGGPETSEKIAERHERYVGSQDSSTGRSFKIALGETRQGVGWVGFWEKVWNDATVYEVGWSVLPAFQRRGIAVMATALAIEEARAERKRRFMHAFPSVENAPSNAICQKLGFTLLGSSQFEYPPGQFMLCNDWRFDLQTG